MQGAIKDKYLTLDDCVNYRDQMWNPEVPKKK